MIVTRIGSRFAIIAALFGAGVEPAAAGQPAANPPVRAARHPFPWALGAVANYQSCGVHARADQVRALNARLRAAEARARTNGMGAQLDRLRADYEAMLAVADMAACAWGPAEALRRARSAVRDFEYWAAHARPYRLPTETGR